MSLSMDEMRGTVVESEESILYTLPSPNTESNAALHCTDTISREYRSPQAQLKGFGSFSQYNYCSVVPHHKAFSTFGLIHYLVLQCRDTF